MNSITPSRKCPRLPDYDYSQSGAYFITICTHDRLSLFGNVIDGQVALSEIGEVLEQCWYGLPTHYPGIVLDEFVIMPNHFHGIVVIETIGPKKSASVSEIIGMFKSFAVRRMRDDRLATPEAIWQRGFHDHVIRSDKSLQAIREYIVNNPVNWDQDDLNPLVPVIADRSKSRGAARPSTGRPQTGPYKRGSGLR